MDTPFSSSAQVFRWLSRFINLEMGRRPSSFRPERMRVLAEAAGNPQLCAPALHVAGSKGKGSVTAMASSILRQAGYKPARFMSPHVTEYRERITCDNDFFDEEKSRKKEKREGLRFSTPLKWLYVVVSSENISDSKMKAIKEGFKKSPALGSLYVLYTGSHPANESIDTGKIDREAQEGFEAAVKASANARGVKEL